MGINCPLHGDQPTGTAVDGNKRTSANNGVAGTFAPPFEMQYIDCVGPGRPTVFGEAPVLANGARPVGKGGGINVRFGTANVVWPSPPNVVPMTWNKALFCAT